MPIRHRITVIGMFMLGTLVVITAIVRLTYLIKAFSGLAAFETADTTCKYLGLCYLARILIV